jgi:hypothetical protein
LEVKSMTKETAIPSDPYSGRIESVLEALEQLEREAVEDPGIWNDPEWSKRYELILSEMKAIDRERRMVKRLRDRLIGRE